MNALQDIVAQVPDPILQLIRLGGQENKDYSMSPGYVAEIFNRDYFIHTRAMLPLKDFKSGVGFGLWVSISKQDFDLYLRAENNDELYRHFSSVGSLANDWPGFPGTFGDRVRVRTVFLDQKVYITEYLSEPKDVLMRRSLLATPDDQETKDHIRNLAMSYIIELNEFADSSNGSSTQNISD